MSGNAVSIERYCRRLRRPVLAVRYPETHSINKPLPQLVPVPHKSPEALDLRCAQLSRRPSPRPRVLLDSTGRPVVVVSGAAEEGGYHRVSDRRPDGGNGYSPAICSWS